MGEGYEDDITLDNVRGSSKQGTSFVEENILEVVEADVGTVHLNFGDCAIGEMHQMTFTLTNHSSTDPYRFSWAAQPNITFIPAIGHLHPRCSKDIIAEFKATEPTSFQNMPMPCKIVKITFPQPLAQVADWDDRMSIIRWVTKKPRKSISSPVDDERVSSPSKAAGKKGDGKKEDKKTAEKEKVEDKKDAPKAVEEVEDKNAPKIKVVETEPEPAHTTMDESARELPLSSSATADYACFSCEVEEIQFKDTLMFQTRVYKFNLYNNGNILLDYIWTMANKQEKVSFNDRPMSANGNRRPDLDQEELDRPPFQISPDCGSILVGHSQEFTVTFSPLDCVSSETLVDCRLAKFRMRLFSKLEQIFQNV